MTADLAALAAAVDAAIPPSLRREWDEFVLGQRVLLGRQGIFTGRGDVFGYELCYRSDDRTAAQVSEGRSAEQQDHATRHVIRAAFAGPGVSSVARDRRVFVNFPRSYLVADGAVPFHPDQLVIEVVDSAQADDEVVAGVRRLRALGFRIAIDDFVGAPSQRRLLPSADYVKIDARDLDVEGRPLLDLARSHGAQLVAQFVESHELLDSCRAHGFELFQGDALEATTVIDLTAVMPSQRGR